MIAYFINENNRVCFVSTKLDITRPGLTKITSDTILSNPGEFFWNGSSFCKYPPVSHSISSHLISTTEEAIITLPSDTTTTILGPGLQTTISTELIEFSSDRRGVFTFWFKRLGYSDTSTTIEVI